MSAINSVVVLLPGILPSANVLKRKFRNPHAYKRLRDSWQRMCWGLIQGQDRQWLLVQSALRTKMRVDVTLQHSRAYDPDNLVASVKPILDGLVNLGFLAADDPEHLELHVTQLKIRQNETTVCIREAV